MSKQYTTCALPGCSEPVIPGRPTFRLGGYNAEYHSRGCVTIAFELMRQKKPYAKAQPEKVDYVKADERQEAAERAEAAREENVKVKASEFGGAEVYRRYCDNPACKAPITVSWKGRRGEYCSNNCLKTEKEKNIMADETNETTSPIAAGAPATKKGKAAKPAPSKKVAAKAPAAKKAAKPVAAKKAAASGDRASFPKDGVIKIVKKAELAAHGRRGKAGDAFDALKDGQTVEKFREAVNKKNPKNGSWYAGFTLKFATDEGWISIK